MKTKKKEKPDFSKMGPEELEKYEIAKELFLYDRILENGWESLTAREAGKVGGILAGRRRKRRRDEM